MSAAFDTRRALEDPVKSSNSSSGTMSVREKEALTSAAKSMTESLLETTDLLGGIPWCLVHEKHGISLFRADVGNNVPCNVHAVCKVTCEIEDVAESMITSSTPAYTRMMEMLSSDFIEGAVIENIVEPTALTPHRYVGLKWVAFKSSSKFTKDRDFTILEYVDMIEDDQGQKIAVRVMESVAVPKTSRFAESQTKYVRDVVPLMGFMYHTTKKAGELRMTYTCNFDNGDLPAWAANSAIQSHVEKCINGILKYIETFRAKKETIVLPQQVMSMCEQDHCKVCERNFCVLRRRYNCLKCGEVICSSCSRLRNAVVPDHGERQLRVCTACVLEVRRVTRNATDSPRAGTASRSPNHDSFLSLRNTASSSSSSTVRDGSVASTMTLNCASPAKQVHQQQSVDSPAKPKSMLRTHSFTAPTKASASSSDGDAGTPKRRSYDDLLEPVRSRLMEHTAFSANPEVIEIPKASFPLRSLSDGFVMRKGNFFTSRRRGSPADLAISVDAFKQHQHRMAGGSSGGGGNADAELEDSDYTDTDESLRQFEYFSTSTSIRTGGTSSGANSACSSPTSGAQSPVSLTAATARHAAAMRSRRQLQTTSLALEGLLSPLHATQPLIEDGTKSRKQLAFESKERPQQQHAQVFPAMSIETKAKLDAAIRHSQTIIDDAAYANNLAQHARKLSHHRVIALQREYDVAPPQQQPQLTNSASQSTTCSFSLSLSSSSGSCSSNQLETTSSRRVTTTVQATTVGVTLLESSDLDKQVDVLTRALEKVAKHNSHDRNNQLSDADRRCHASSSSIAKAAPTTPTSSKHHREKTRASSRDVRPASRTTSVGVSK